jgi:hypothetical protein
MLFPRYVLEGEVDQSATFMDRQGDTMLNGKYDFGNG